MPLHPYVRAEAAALRRLRALDALVFALAGGAVGGFATVILVASPVAIALTEAAAAFVVTLMTLVVGAAAGSARVIRQREEAREEAVRFGARVRSERRRRGAGR